MLTISKPLSASQAQAYHSKEFTSAEQAYYSQKGEVLGEWQGKLAQEWGLSGKATEEEFQRLANGQHPLTAEQLVRHRQSFAYKAGDGETVKAMEHRAGWDATFSAPKSVSLTALVGNDGRVREAHTESVRVALDEMERFVQAHMGGSNPEETTGKWVAVKFEHDSARPVDGYAAPQLHTHAVFFNVTVTPDRKAHAIEPRELYRSQKYATAVYQAELGYRLTRLGYEIEPGKNGAPEIKGYSKEYLEANSLRSQQIRAHLEKEGLVGAGAAQIAAHRTRDAKSPLSASEMLERQRELAAAFGNQPARVVEPPAWGDRATTFTIPGIKIMVKVDLAFQAADGRYLIYDWKTGKGDEDARAQLELYAIWAHKALGYPLDAISAFEVSLFKQAVSSVRLSEDAMFYRLEQVRKSSDLIQALVTPDGGSAPNIRDFSYARQVSTCRRCPFQRVCRQFP